MLLLLRYGSRAANGVILLQQKVVKPQKKGIGVEYNGGLQAETILCGYPEMQNEFGMGWNGNHNLIRKWFGDLVLTDLCSFGGMFITIHRS